MAYALEDEFGDIIGKARRGQNPVSKRKSQLLRVLQRHNLLVWKSIP